jgi:hypothetical protein
MESVSLSQHDDGIIYTHSYLLRAQGKDVIQMCPKFNTQFNLSHRKYYAIEPPTFFLTMCWLVGWLVGWFIPVSPVA